MKRKELVKRILYIIAVLFGISFISFLLLFISPGDPVSSMFASTGTVPSEQVLEETREKLGLNRSFVEQYGDWLSKCLRGDFGFSFSMHRPVSELLKSRLFPTLKLAIAALALMIVFALPLGMLSALYKNKPLDNAIRALSFFGISMPGFWIGLIFLYIFSSKLHLVPAVSVRGSFNELILPSMTLAFAMTAKYTRQVRTAFLEELNKDYVTGARARGLSESAILWKHVFPKALLPLVTLLGISLGSLLGGTAIVEVIFGYQGMGNLAVSAIKAMDYPLIQGYVLWIALIYMVINLAIDISYRFIDPRIREERR